MPSTGNVCVYHVVMSGGGQRLTSLERNKHYNLACYLYYLYLYSQIITMYFGWQISRHEYLFEDSSIMINLQLK